MRKKLHNLIDFIFNTIENIERWLYFFSNHVKCLFRKPKYKVGFEFKAYDRSHLVKFIYKNYKWNTIFYETDNKQISYSEQLLDFYTTAKGINE